jgi:two-component system, sensor histidine kinase ChiS
LQQETDKERIEMDASVLIVDDDELFLGALETSFMTAGYSTASVSTGQEALNVLQQGELPSIVLVDLMLPKMSGWELIERIQRDATFCQIPIVVMSGYPKMVSAGKLRGVPFVEKPFRFEELLATIGRVARPRLSR